MKPYALAVFVALLSLVGSSGHAVAHDHLRLGFNLNCCASMPRITRLITMATPLITRRLPPLFMRHHRR